MGTVLKRERTSQGELKQVEYGKELKLAAVRREPGAFQDFSETR